MDDNMYQWQARGDVFHPARHLRRLMALSNKNTCCVKVHHTTNDESNKLCVYP